MALEHEESKKGKRGRKRRKHLNDEDKPSTWPSREIRREMVNKIVKMDKENPFREYGGVFGIDQNGNERILWAVPGKEYNPCVDGYAKISVWSKAKSEPSLQKYFGSFHSHPSGRITKGEKPGFQPGTYSVDYFKLTEDCVFHQKPSEIDIQNYRSLPDVYEGNAFVFACRDKKVYEYNGTGIVNRYTLNEFIS
jgi:hypothetical protein